MKRERGGRCGGKRSRRGGVEMEDKEEREIEGGILSLREPVKH